MWWLRTNLHPLEPKIIYCFKPLALIEVRNLYADLLQERTEVLGQRNLCTMIQLVHIVII